MTAEFAVVGGEFKELVVDTVNNDALYRDDEGHVHSPENDPANTPILVTEQAYQRCQYFLGGRIERRGIHARSPAQNLLVTVWLIGDVWFDMTGKRGKIKN